MAEEFINVTVKGVGQVSVPASWTDEQIAAELTRKYAKPQPPPQPIKPPLTLSQQAKLKAEGELGPFASMVRGANRGGATLMQLLSNAYGVTGNPEAMVGLQKLADERNSLPSAGGVSDVVEQAVRAAPAMLAGAVGGVPAAALTVAAENLHKGPAAALGYGGLSFLGGKAVDAYLPRVLPAIASRVGKMGIDPERLSKIVDWLTKTSWNKVDFSKPAATVAAEEVAPAAVAAATPAVAAGNQLLAAKPGVMNAVEDAESARLLADKAAQYLDPMAMFVRKNMPLIKVRKGR